MNQAVLRFTIFAMLLAATPLRVGAQEKRKSATPVVQSISLKGISLGMTAMEIDKVLPSVNSFTIGGVAGSSPLSLILKEGGLLDQLYFFFPSAGFEAVQAAVIGRYPRMKCKESAIQNRMGGNFIQIQCLLSGADGVLRLTKYGPDLDHSALSLVSHEVVRNKAERDAQALGDI